MDISTAQSIKLRLPVSQIIGLIAGVALSVLITLTFDLPLRNHTALIIAATITVPLCWIITNREFNILRNRYNSFVVGEAILHSMSGIVMGVGIGFVGLFTSPFVSYHVGLLIAGVSIVVVSTMPITCVWLRPISKIHCERINT